MTQHAFNVGDKVTLIGVVTAVQTSGYRVRFNGYPKELIGHLVGEDVLAAAKNVVRAPQPPKPGDKYRLKGACGYLSARLGVVLKVFASKKEVLLMFEGNADYHSYALVKTYDELAKSYERVSS